MKTETIKWSELSERERDALVAEKVMGFDVQDHAFGMTAARAYRWRDDKGQPWQSGVPQYSTSISDAMAVVEKMERDGWSWDLCCANDPGTYSFVLWKDGDPDGEIFEGLSKNKVECISLAALRASGVNVE
jgi:hypothetical protein